jgi:hypothetical protein
MGMRFRAFLRKALIYFRNIVLSDLAIGLLVSLTFIFKGQFSFLAFSERIFYAGIIVILLGAIVGIAAMFAGRSFGIPVIIRRPAEAKNLLDHFEEYRDEVERRYDVSILIWLVGLGCIGLSALVQTFLA